jgi:hypothetical protein
MLSQQQNNKPETSERGLKLYDCYETKHAKRFSSCIYISSLAMVMPMFGHDYEAVIVGGR